MLLKLTPSGLDVAEFELNLEEAFGSTGSKSKESEDESHWYARRLNLRSDEYVHRGEYKAARVLLLEALATQKEASPPNEKLQALTFTNLGTVSTLLCDYPEAERCFTQALKIQKKRFGKKSLQVAIVQDCLGSLCTSLGRYEEAEKRLKDAICIRRKNDKRQENPELATSFNNIGCLYCYRDVSYSNAKSFLERAREIREKALGSTHHLVAESLSNLAMLYRRQGNNLEAESHYQQALKIYETLSGSEHHPEEATTLNSLAVIYSESGRYTKAEPLYERALQVCEMPFGPEHPRVTSALTNLAICYERQGRHAKAKPLYKRALSIAERAFGPQHGQTVFFRQQLAQLSKKAHSPELEYTKELGYFGVIDEQSVRVDVGPEQETKKPARKDEGGKSLADVRGPADFMGRLAKGIRAKLDQHLDRDQALAALEQTANALEGAEQQSSRKKPEPAAEAGVGEGGLAPVRYKVLTGGLPTLPSREHWLLIPLLDNKPLSGRELTHLYTEFTGDKVLYQAVYKSLERAQDKGWVVCKEGKDARSNAYSLTPEGRDELRRSAESSLQAEDAARAFTGVIHSKLLL